MYSKDSAALHVPPLGGLGGALGGCEHTHRVRHVAPVVGRRDVDVHVVGMMEVFAVVRVGRHTPVLLVLHRRVDAHLSALEVVHGGDLEALRVATEQPRLLPTVARHLRAHHRDLRKDAAPTVGLLARIGDRVLVILPEVEVPRKPRLDRAVLADERDEVAHILSRVIEPAAAVDDVALLRARWPGGADADDYHVIAT